MTKGQAMASIEVADGSDLRLGGIVKFNVEGYPKKVHGMHQRVQVQAFSVEGDLIYGEAGSAAQATCDGTDSLGYCGFLLGGAPGEGSIWARTGGPAHCIATMFYFDNSGPVQEFVPLASCEFEATGA